ncbi:sensor histidine kinase [Microbacterium ulmi]|uniref:histidine kinase n=1 Tax=Microbacterium ulmi TaxID=179095 RepID=A0A7Y2LZU9_9MICO|nr:histidine kinase [Microbacterium ulmi]NII68932.1 signal transduction histidine kinase [Microbacterium ulmi]NNH03915.1 sensor histidine kinase [Microbacterium ulmi]
MRKAADDAVLSPRHGPPGWAGDALAALFIVGAALAPFPDAASHPHSPLQYAFALLPAALLPLRRRLPLWVLGACVAVYVVAILSGFMSPGILLAIVVAMFGAANRLSRRTSLIALGVAVAAIFLTVVVAAGDVFEPRIFPAVVTVALAAAAGDGTRSRREYLEAVTERAIRAEQTREAEARRRVSDERLRIARDLHDAVAHQISVISLNAGVATAALETRPEKTREALATIRTASRTVLGEIGDLLAVLRAEDRVDGEDATAPQPSLRGIDALVASFRESGLDTVVRIEGDLARLPLPTDAVAYRIVQEGLTNALKHGAEHRAHVLVEIGSDAARIVVANPTGGAPRSAEPRGFGLVGLRERVAAVRGSVETAETAAGYRLEAALPIPEESA